MTYIQVQLFSGKCSNLIGLTLCNVWDNNQESDFWSVWMKVVLRRIAPPLNNTWNTWRDFLLSEKWTVLGQNKLTWKVKCVDLLANIWNRLQHLTVNIQLDIAKVARTWSISPYFPMITWESHGASSCEEVWSLEGVDDISLWDTRHIIFIRERALEPIWVHLCQNHLSREREMLIWE